MVFFSYPLYNIINTKDADNMNIDFNDIEEKVNHHYWDGDGDFLARIYNDGLNKILKGTLKKGCSIGLHKHDNTSEIIYVISGNGVVHCDGVTKMLSQGDCHYCKDGSSHSLSNPFDDDFVFFAVIPNHFK